MIIDLNYRVDILKGIVSQNAEHPLYYDDQNAHRVNVSLYRGQEEVNLSGLSCNGYVVFVKEGASIGPLTGEVSNNTCSVVLPHEAYQHPGAIRVEIKLIEGDSVTTVLMLTGHVSSGRGDRIIDITGSIVPSLDSLKATIEELESRIAAIEVSDIVELERKVVRHDTAQFLCRVLFGNEDDWSVANYNSMSYSATKTGRIITYKGNNISNSGFQSVNLTGVPGAPHTARSGNFSALTLADTDFVPIPSILKSISKQSALYPVMLFLSGYMHYDRYNNDAHAAFSFDYVLRRYNTETETYEYTTRTTTNLGLINTPTTADGVDRISIAQLIPDGRGGDYVVNWDEWEEMAIFAMRRNRMSSGTMLLTPSLEIYGDQKPVVYSAEQTLEFDEQRQARENIGASNADVTDLLAEPIEYWDADRTVTLSGRSLTRTGGYTYTLNGTASGNLYYRLSDVLLVISTTSGMNNLTSSIQFEENVPYTLTVVPVSGRLVRGDSFYFRVTAEDNTLVRSLSVTDAAESATFYWPDSTKKGKLVLRVSTDTVTENFVFRVYLTRCIYPDRNIAETEASVSRIGYGVGSLLTMGGTLYKTTQAIVAGDTITPGINVTSTTVADQLAERDTAIAAVEADAEDIYMEPWQLVAKKYFLPDSTGNLTVRRNHITYRPSASANGASVRSLIGAYAGDSTTLGNYTPTIDQLIPVSVFGDAIKIGFYLDAAGTTRYPRFAYKFCTVDGETVTPISDAQGAIPATAASNVLAEKIVTVPDGATHVFFGLLYSNGYTGNVTYDMVYKVDKG